MFSNSRTQIAMDFKNFVLTVPYCNVDPFFYPALWKDFSQLQQKEFDFGPKLGRQFCNGLPQKISFFSVSLSHLFLKIYP